MITGLPRRRRVPEPTRVEGERRVPLAGWVVVAIIVGLAVLRELVAPGARLFADGIEIVSRRGPPLWFVRPLSLVLTIVANFFALGALARMLDRRGCGPALGLIATGGLSLALGTLCALGLKIAVHMEYPLVRALIAGPISGLQGFALWVLAVRYPKVADDARVRALEAEQLRRAAELSRLREHLQPHFLRNTLNAIAAFVSEDPDAARELLAALGDLLSERLEHESATQTLGEQTAWLRRYSEIFEARHRGALRFSWDLDPAASAVVLPRLLLQPLVENAVRHGALARADGGAVTVQTRRSGAGVTVIVQDDGPGFDARRPEGLGLHLVRRRLAIECRDSHLRIESSASGTRAIVELR